MKQLMRLALTLCVVLMHPQLWAHRLSDADLQLKIEQASVAAQLQLRLIDVQRELNLDADGDQQLRWGEVLAARDHITSWLNAQLRLQAGDTPCNWQLQRMQVSDRLGEPHLWLALAAQCPSAPERLEYALFFERDDSHRGIVTVRDGDTELRQILSPARPGIALQAGASLTSWWSFVESGVHHIIIGYDHLLFLFSLLLPAVLIRRGGRWHGAESPVQATLHLLWVVTAFTLAHSLTLISASLGWLQLPISWVERAIAASVILAALNNIWPLITRRHAALAFGFGLLHGFGFAAVLDTAGLQGTALVAPLLGFNLGVELGQLAVVALVLPILLLLRNQKSYSRWIMPLSSALIAAIALYWLMDRF